MLEERRNAHGTVVWKPLGKQSLINPRKVEITVGCEKESWIQLDQKEVHFRSLTYSSSSFSISTFMCVNFCILRENFCLHVNNLQWHLTIFLPVPPCFCQTVQHRKNWKKQNILLLERQKLGYCNLYCDMHGFEPRPIYFCISSSFRKASRL